MGGGRGGPAERHEDGKFGGYGLEYGWETWVP